MLPNGKPYKGKWADRRGRLSLLWCTILIGNNHLIHLTPYNVSPP
ncbi:hypothetical protein HMPREF0973_00392 [Prevotella veroralis F0319]|uniref:Uncharacterized protein n=1 Tax=Prevotella veroralis F0319 TaxID=649761 RepID=C9MLB7_9BACT|nr:hypothetical protein HMPREF0973_00392 [Prevotella veroralis F0319]